MTPACTTGQKGHTGHDTTTAVIINVNIDISVGNKCPILHLHTAHSGTSRRYHQANLQNIPTYQHEHGFSPTLQTPILREAYTGNFYVTYPGTSISTTGSARAANLSRLQLVFQRGILRRPNIEYPGIPITPPSPEEPASLLQLVVQPWIIFSDTPTGPEDPVKPPNMSMHTIQLAL